MSLCLAGGVLRSFARRQFAQPVGANNKEIRSSNRKTFVSSNAAFEEVGPLPKIINVSSLASSDDVKFSQSLVNYRRSQNTKFFYHLPIHSQLKLLTRLKCSPVNRPSIHELAQEVNIPFDNMKGWLNSIKSRYPNISALEKVPQSKIDILNDEFALSETLGEDRLTLLSYTLKIDEQVIQQFFDSKRDCKKKLRARPTGASASKSKLSLNTATFGNFLVPCLKLTRCSVPPKKPTHFNDKGRRKIFTREQLTILRDKFSRREFPNREEIDSIVRQFGSSVKSTHVTNWFSKTRYRKKLKAPSTPVKIEPRSTRFRENEVVPSSPEIIELRSSRSQEKLGALENIVKIEPRSDNQLEKYGPIPVAVQNALFEEYKKSPVLTARRKNVLQTNFKIQSSRIHAFFNKLSSLLRGKTESDVTKLLTSYPKAFLSKIAAEHRRNRYISVMRCQKLGKQLGTSRRVVADWFSNARLYELLSGNRFHPIAKPLAQSPLVHELTSVREEKQLSPADATSNEAAKSEASVKSNGRTAALNKKASLRGKPRIRYSTAVLEILFNAFKQSSDLSSSSLSRICSASKLSTPQVCLWFRRTRRNLIAIGTEEFLFRSDYRNLNLSQEQIVVLEETFQKHPYENEIIKEELADQLKVRKRTISSWFQNRRHYDLIVFGLPKLVEIKKNKYFSGAQNESAEDMKNVDCQKFDSSNALEMAKSNSNSIMPNFEVRLFQLTDIPLNNSEQNFHPSVDDGCDLLDVTAVKEERLFEESDSPSKMQTSSADVSLTENSSVICRIDSALEKQADGSVPLSEMLERVANNLDPSTDDDDEDETHLSQSLSVADGANAVSQLDICDASKLGSLYAPRAEEHPYSGVEPAVMPSIKNSSTEKTVAICEAAIAVLEELSMGKPRPLVLKPLANDVEVSKTVAATPEGLSDSSAVLPNVSKSLVDHETTTAMPKTSADSFSLLFNASIPLAAPMNICTDLAATPEVLLDASKPPSDVSKPLVDHSYVSGMETDVHEELLDGSESMVDCSDSLADVSKPLVDDLNVGKTVADSSEEHPNCLELSPNISKPQADLLEVCNSLVAAPEELPDTSEAMLDTSMPLTDHLDTCNTGNTVTTTSEELPDDLEPLPDISEPQNNQLDVNVSNSVAATPVELPDSLKPLPDDSKSLVDHSGVSNTKAATPTELSNGSNPLLDVSKPLVNHSQVLTNGTESPINEESRCLSTEPPISPKNVTDQLESRFSRLSATSKNKKLLLSAIQRKTLLHEYKRSPFVSAPKAQMLATDLNLPVTRIKLWFRQRRCKDSTWMASKKLVGEKSKQSESSMSFSPFQLFVLKREFGENSVLTTERLTHLCQKLKTTRKPIIAWFQDRHKAEIAKM